MQVTGNVFISGTLRDINGDLLEKTRINLYHGNQEHLACFKTNLDGSFRVQIKKSVDYQQINLLFRLCHKTKINTTHHLKEKGDVLDSILITSYTLLKVRHEKEQLVLPITFNKQEIFLGEIRMAEGLEQEQVPLSYMLNMVKAAIPAFTKGITLNFKTAVLREHKDKTIEEIQKSYGVKPIPLTDANIFNLLTNGIAPIYFKKEGNGILSAEFNWNNVLFDKESLPNTKAYFSGWQDPDPQPKIEKIEVQYRKGLGLPKGEEDMHVKTTHYPIDENFEVIKRKFNNGAFIFGQTIFHLGWGHVYGARIAQLAHDYLAGTKLGELLFPHCKFIRKITNDLGKAQILGEGGILDISPLSPDGIVQLIGRGIGALNPFTFRPREPLNKNHILAIDQKFFYKALKEPIKKFIDENWIEISINEWSQVRAFFAKVHSGSPPYHQWECEVGDISDWEDSREIGGIPDNGVERTKSDPSDWQLRSIPLIADDWRGPKEHDKKLIELFVRHFIHTVTYWHSALHRTQYIESPHFPYSKDVNFSPMSLEGDGEEKYGGMKKEDVIRQQEVNKIFQNFPINEYALTDPKSGVNSEIVKAIEGIASELTIPIGEISFSTVI